MRIAFLNPPFLPKFSRSQRSPGVIKSGTMYYPYWLAHAAGLCMQQGHTVTLLDAPAEGWDTPTTLERLRRFCPELVAIDTSTPSIASDIDVARAVKEQFPEAFVALCGTHATALPEQSLVDLVPDAVLLGEYDLTAAELARAIESGPGAESVPGLYLQNGVRTPKRKLIEDLDTLPWVAPVYDRFLDVNNYYFSLAGHPMVMLISGRGCPNRCFFCLYPQVMHGRSYRTRSPEHMAGEVEYVVRKMPQVKQVVFEDDTFTADQDRTVRFCQLLIAANLKIPWFANVRVDTDPDTLAIMKQAGFRACAVGFESGSPELLSAMGKGIRIQQARKFMEQARKLDILVHGCFMVAFPGETEKTMQQTLDFAIELSPDSAQFYPVFPYPGTEAYDWAEKTGALRTTDYRRWLTEQGAHACVLDLRDLPAERIWAFCESAYRAFHFRPKYMLKKLVQALLHPAEGIRSLKSFFYYLRYLLGGKGR